MLIDKDLRLSISGCFWLFYASKYSNLFCIFIENDFICISNRNKYSTILNMIVVNLDVMMARRKMSLGELPD